MSEQLVAQATCEIVRAEGGSEAAKAEIFFCEAGLYLVVGDTGWANVILRLCHRDRII